jgi:vacuolar-type H+-ATPase subunit B/Vma2
MPKSTIRIDTTAAKIGRSMKKCGNRIDPSPEICVRRNKCGVANFDLSLKGRGVF